MAEQNNVIPYSLRAIYIRSSHMEMATSFDPTAIHLIDGQFRVLDGNVECRTQSVLGTDGQSSTLKLCLFTTPFEFRYTIHGETTGEGDTLAEAAKISAEVAADYLVNGDEFPPIEELNKWKASSVLLHTWPYWREFCHNSLLRMNLPPALIPLLNMLPPPPEKPAPEQKASRTRKLGKKPL